MSMDIRQFLKRRVAAENSVQTSNPKQHCSSTDPDESSSTGADESNSNILSGSTGADVSSSIGADESNSNNLSGSAASSSNSSSRNDWGIGDVYPLISTNINDSRKMELILHRIPSQTYRFPTRQFRDVRKRSGFTNRTCQKQWLEKYEFLSYSTSCDGLFCLACVLFPDSSHRIAKKMISEPYHNWKDFSEDVKKHASHQYHLNSMLLLQNFVSTHNNPETRIDCTINEQNRIRIEKNRKILSSIVKTIVFCGRQGIPLQGHRDDDTVMEF